MTITGANETQFCGRCGSRLESSGTRDYCLRCALDSVLHDTDDGGSDVAPTGFDGSGCLRRFGDYELLAEVARGGMGVVYRARHIGLNRQVALKMVLFGRFADSETLERFHSEARTGARLKHPHIVTIHDLGTLDRQPWFTMDLIDGPNLSDAFRDQFPALREAAQLLLPIVEAISYAHGQGVLHRDLKPSNIVLDSERRPHVTDFGLARLVTSDSNLTRSGQALGSPNYMAPEQAGGAREAFAAADIWSLGAILYFLLTGQPPFAGATVADTLRAAREDEPVSPRRLNSRVPADLETICLKCLQKEPAKRYPTAQALADDLRRFLENQPILARPVGLAGKVGRWCRRKPALATLGATVLVLLLVVVVGAPIAVVRTNRARVELERTLYAADMRLASAALRNGAIRQVQELLDRHRAQNATEDFRGFEWRYLWHAADQSGLVTHQLQGLAKILYDPDLVLVGDTLYNRRFDTGDMLAWDTITWDALPLKLRAQQNPVLWWYPAQQAALAMNDKNSTVTVCRLPSLVEDSVIPVPGRPAHSRPSQAAFSTDLRTLAIGFRDGDINRILVCDLASNSQPRMIGGFRKEVSCLEFSPDSTVLMAACENGEIGLWSVAEGKALPSPERDSSSTTEDWERPPFFGPNSTKLFLNRGRERKALEVWDWSTGKLSLAYQTDLGRLQSFAFSPDGALLAAAGSGELLVLLDANESRLVGAMPANGATIISLAFSPSGRFIISGSLDRTAKVWDVKTQRELATLGSDDRVCGVTFTRDEKSVIALSGDRKIKVWDLRAVLQRGVLLRTAGTIEGFAVSADERAIATKDGAGGIHVWDLVKGAEIQRLQIGEPNSSAAAFAISFSPIDHILAWAGYESLGILDYDSGQRNTFPLWRRYGYSNPAFSPDGHELAFANETNIMFLDIATRKLRPFVSIRSPVLGLAFSPNGSLLASANHGGTLTLWDYASGREITNVLAHPPDAFDIGFSHDGRLLASGGDDATGKLWDIIPGGLRLRHTLGGHVADPALVFSPDGRRVVSSDSGGDNALKLWDTKSGLEIGTLYGHRAGIARVAFSRDGNTIYSAARDGEVRIWQAPPLDQIKAPKNH